MFRHVILSLAFIFLLTVPCCQGEPLEKLYKGVEDGIMDTQIAIWVLTADENKAKAVIEEAFDEMRRIERLMSKYNAASEISSLNKNGHITASPDTFKCLDLAVQVSNMTDGAFDVTVGPLIDVWRTAAKSKTLPTDEQIKAALYLVGARNKLRLDPTSKKASLARAEMKIDLGGIAKGYAVDRAIDKLRLKGLKSGYINAGGDIYFLGKNHLGKPWRVKIYNPFGKNGEPPLDRMELSDRACVTSGHYNRFIQIKGRKLSHIVDPRTGQPASGTASVTVIAPTAALADALATAMSVLRPDESINLAESLKDVEILIAAGNKKANKIITSSGWARFRRRDKQEK